MTKKEFYQHFANLYANEEAVSDFCNEKAESTIDPKIAERLAWINHQIATDKSLKKTIDKK